MIQKIDLPFSEVHPYVRYIQSITFTKNVYPQFIKAYDYRLYFVCSGTGTIVIENTSYSLTKGDLILWPPNTPYHTDHIHNTNPLDLITMNFDFTLNHKDLNYPLPPDLSTIFQKDNILELINVTDAPLFNSVIYLSNMHSVKTYLLDMLTEYKAKKIYYRQKLSGLFTYILSEIARTDTMSDFLHLTEHTIKEIIEYIQQHYSENLTNQTIGDLFNYHPNYLNKQMVLYTGRSLHQYILNCRINNAINLIESTDLPMSAVATQVGFRDFCHFSKFFKQKTGYCPSDFRRSSVNASPES